MKRWMAALLALAIMLSCAALAECEGWAVAKKDTQVRETPDPASKVLRDTFKGDELEYGGFTKYDADGKPWYGVSVNGVTGWIPGADADLKWSTLY